MADKPPVFKDPVKLNIPTADEVSKGALVPQKGIGSKSLLRKAHPYLRAIDTISMLKELMEPQSSYVSDTLETGTKGIASLPEVINLPHLEQFRPLPPEQMPPIPDPNWKKPSIEEVVKNKLKNPRASLARLAEQYAPEKIRYFPLSKGEEPKDTPYKKYGSPYLSQVDDTHLLEISLGPTKSGEKGYLHQTSGKGRTEEQIDKALSKIKTERYPHPFKRDQLVSYDKLVELSKEAEDTDIGQTAFLQEYIGHHLGRQIDLTDRMIPSSKVVPNIGREGKSSLFINVLPQRLLRETQKIQQKNPDLYGKYNPETKETEDSMQGFRYLRNKKTGDVFAADSYEFIHGEIAKEIAQLPEIIELYGEDTAATARNIMEDVISGEGDWESGGLLKWDNRNPYSEREGRRLYTIEAFPYEWGKDTPKKDFKWAEGGFVEKPTGQSNQEEFYITEDDPKLSLDNPGGDWLARKIKYAEEKGRDEYGAPHLGAVTASFRKKVNLPVDLLATFKGRRGEQGQVREKDLAWLKKHMEETGKLPLSDPDDPASGEYAPFITVGYDGVPWVSEGNHRIMAAKALGWKTLPVELRYFDGGERTEGLLFPKRVSTLHRDSEYLSEKTDDPRTTDPSVLEKGIMASKLGAEVAGEIRDLKKPKGQELVKQEKTPSKGQMFRGLGSLMRGRISPIIGAAQLFWGEMPDSVKDDAGEIVDWLRENKMHELVGLEKSGLEYFKQALTPTAQEPKGIMSLPPVLQSGEYASETLGDRVPIYHASPSPEIIGNRFDLGEFSLVEKPGGQGAAMKGAGAYGAQARAVAEDYFEKEPAGRLLVDGKLLPKSYNFPYIETARRIKTMRDAGTLSDAELEKLETGMDAFSKKYGVDREDLGPFKLFVSKVYSEGMDMDGESPSVTVKQKLRDAIADTLKEAELTRDAPNTGAGSGPETVAYLERDAGKLQRILDVANKYSLKDTPGVLVEYAYHPEDWKNMIDLDMKMKDQPEILEKVKKTWMAKNHMEHLSGQRDPYLLRNPKPLEDMTGDELSRELLDILERVDDPSGTKETDSRYYKIQLAREFAGAGIPGNKYFDSDSRYAEPPPDVTKPIGFTLNGNKITDYLRLVGKPLGLTGFGDNTPAVVVSNVQDIIMKSGGLPEALDNATKEYKRRTTVDDPERAREIDFILDLIKKGVELEFEYPEPKEDTRTKNAVVWDQKAMDRATKPVVLEGGLPPRKKAEGGFVDKSLYN